jgi:hypothetical protein
LDLEKSYFVIGKENNLFFTGGSGMVEPFFGRIVHELIHHKIFAAQYGIQETDEKLFPFLSIRGGILFELFIDFGTSCFDRMSYYRKGLAVIARVIRWSSVGVVVLHGKDMIIKDHVQKPVPTFLSLQNMNLCLFRKIPTFWIGGN